MDREKEESSQNEYIESLKANLADTHDEIENLSLRIQGHLEKEDEHQISLSNFTRREVELKEKINELSSKEEQFEQAITLKNELQKSYEKDQRYIKELEFSNNHFEKECHDLKNLEGRTQFNNKKTKRECVRTSTRN